MKVSQILNKAAELVEKGWCQDTEARDARGTEVPWDHDSATKFCASGAIRKVANEGHEGYVTLPALVLCWKNPSCRTIANLCPIAQSLRE